MAKVVMYRAGICPYCHFAGKLLRSKGVEFETIDVGQAPALREEMIRLSGRMTVPQIFIDGVHVGGYTELAALEREGRLDAMLAGDSRERA